MPQDAWEPGAWTPGAWVDGAWVTNYLDTSTERLSAIHVKMPWRHVGFAQDRLGFHVGKRQAAALMYGGVWAIEYGVGVEAPYTRNAVEATR